MGTQSKYHRFAFIFIVYCYTLVAFQLQVLHWDWTGQGTWVDQIYALVGLSFPLSVALFVFRKQSYTRFLLLLKVFLLFPFADIVFIVGRGSGTYYGLEVSLLAILVIEISVHFGGVASLILSGSIVFFGLLNVLLTQAFDDTFPRLPASTLFAFVANGIVISLVANAVVGIVRNLEQQRSMNDRMSQAAAQLIDANIGFQNFATSAGRESAKEERTRLSRDIHDTAVHSLINIIMLAESIDDKIALEQSEVSGMLKMIISQAKDAVKETRQSLRELRNMEEEKVRGLRAIHELVTVFSKSTGVTVGINYGNLPAQFGGDIDEALYRMIQEGLTNAFRHGKATKIQISLWVVRGEQYPEISFTMHDNGKGAEHIKKGIGLLGMEERIQRLKGRIEAESNAHGFNIVASIPFEEA